MVCAASASLVEHFHIAQLLHVSNVSLAPKSLLSRTIATGSILAIIPSHVQHHTKLLCIYKLNTPFLNPPLPLPQRCCCATHLLSSASFALGSRWCPRSPCRAKENLVIQFQTSKTSVEKRFSKERQVRSKQSGHSLKLKQGSTSIGLNEIPPASVVCCRWQEYNPASLGRLEHRCMYVELAPNKFLRTAVCRCVEWESARSI